MTTSTLSQSDMIYVFNYLPNRYLHRTWWQSLDHGRELAQLANFERAETRVAEIILKLFKLTGCYKHEFISPLEKLSLLSETDLCKLANHLGVCFTCKDISSSILKSEKVEYKQELGSDAYLFAHSKAKILRDSSNITESYPVKTGSLLIHNHTIGLHVLGKAFMDSERALIQRLVLKLGRPYEQFIQRTSYLKPLSSSQSDCISLVESVSQHLNLPI